MIHNQDIQIRDPFVFANIQDKKYYLFGSTDENIWGKGTGFDVYIGSDLEFWDGPYPVFRPRKEFYSDTNFWAPEVYEHHGKYYMFATFLRKDNGRRGTGILKADNLQGPFKPHSETPVTPKRWESLDGTLYIDADGKPWMVFCHEWVQVGDGAICAMRLSDDLTRSVDSPETLFRASDVAWPTSFKHNKFTNRQNYVMDGPFLFHDSQGDLLMLWASFVNNVYAQGISKSETGHITGPWIHMEKPIYQNDGGHGMVFKTFDHQIMLSLHTPNDTPHERPIFIPISEVANKLY